MNRSWAKKGLIFTIIVSIIIAMFFITPDKDYLKSIGALIKLKAISQEKQHSLNLQKMRPDFRPQQSGN